MRTNFIFTREDGHVYNLSENAGYMPYKPEIQNSNRNIERVDVLGRDSTLSFDMGSYKNRTITIPVFHLNYDTIHNLSYAFNGLPGELKFNYKQGFYKVKTIDNVFTRDAKGIPETDIFITIEPFIYMSRVKESLEFTSADRVKTIENTGNINSKPVVTIYGNGNINVEVNDIEFVLTGVIGKITLNAETLSCYKDTENCNSKAEGDLTKLAIKSGINTINAKLGTVSKIEIEYNPVIYE